MTAEDCSLYRASITCNAVYLVPILSEIHATYATCTMQFDHNNYAQFDHYYCNNLGNRKKDDGQ